MGVTIMKYNIIENCKKYIGKPYVWGGESMKEGGYDCSGFVYNVLNDSGIKVGRTTVQGYFDKFKNNSNTIEPGTLLFFGKSTKSISHVAICANDGYMYESIGGKKNNKSNPGKGVTLSKMTRRKDFVAARKPFIEVVYPTIKVPKPTLKIGSRGREVEYLQAFLCLNNPSCHTPIDGHYGKDTYKWVREFQKNNGLVINGIYNNHTRDKVRELITKAGLRYGD